jgi:7,8-dihydroneopterin aldolase/epimerase/oxygenase
MTDDLHLAFAHPAERAAAVNGLPPDRISLRDHVRSVEIGAFQAERGILQRVRFNIVVELAPLGDLADDVDRILSYDRLTEAIDTALSAERLNLLETLAARVAELVLLAPQAQRVFVRIEKLDRGPGDLGVEIVRGRDQVALAPQAAMPHPRVVMIGSDAMTAPDLPRLIRQLASDAPLILCCGAPDVPRPRAAQALPQHRIDLLALDQNAWVLAGRDRHWIVVATRTELDWAARQGQISVWAPSKMVLDAVDSPAAGPGDAAALIGWFAGQVAAVELVVLDGRPPAAPVPVRALTLDNLRS